MRTAETGTFKEERDSLKATWTSQGRSQQVKEARGRGRRGRAGRGRGAGGPLGLTGGSPQGGWGGE